MNPSQKQALGNATQVAARIGSGLAVLACALALALDRNLPLQIERFLTERGENVDLAIYLGLMTIGGVGYALTLGNRFAVAGSVAVVAAVALMFAWCQSRLSFYPSPFLAALAAPALLCLLHAVVTRPQRKLGFPVANVEPQVLPEKAEAA